MLELLNNQLVFRFPEVHPECMLTVTLHRTLRIPDDGKEYPLPPSLGHFPMVHVDDYKNKVSPKWVGRGGVMVPMYQSEALWFSLHPHHVSDRGVPYPFAIKCATGKVSALTGKEWSKKLKADDYMVAPGQPWLDGYVVADGTVRQFVAAPLGLGVTAEGQITGKEEFGGLQLEVLPMLLSKFEAKYPKVSRQITNSMRRGRIRLQGMGITGPTGPTGPTGSMGPTGPSGQVYCATKSAGTKRLISEEKCSSSISFNSITDSSDVELCEAQNYSSDAINMLSLEESREKRPEMHIKLDMGLAAGGRMRQQVFKDPHGIEVWDREHKTRIYIHMANSIGWQHVTGSLPPHPPMSASDYTSHGFPWFDYYEENAKSQSGTDKLKGLKSLAELQNEKNLPLLPENQSTTVSPKQTVKLKTHKNEVRDGSWK